MSKCYELKDPTEKQIRGEKARIKIIRGIDLGRSFVLLNKRVTFGRSEEADIQLRDLKLSRIHGEFVYENQNWVVRDLKSINGIEHNLKPVQLAKLHSQDVLTLGETWMQFFGEDSSVQDIEGPLQNVDDIIIKIKNYEQQKGFIHSLGIFKGLRLPNGEALFDPELRKKIIMYGVIGVGLFMLLTENETPEELLDLKRDSFKRDTETIYSAYLPSINLDEEAKKTVDTFYQSGFREFREKNYTRAKVSFETVLQIDPNHRLAKIYLENCKINIQKEIDQLLALGKKSYSVGKMKLAKSYFENVTRILIFDQTHPAFIEASEHIKMMLETKEEGHG